MSAAMTNGVFWDPDIQRWTVWIDRHPVLDVDGELRAWAEYDDAKREYAAQREAVAA